MTLLMASVLTAFESAVGLKSPNVLTPTSERFISHSTEVAVAGESLPDVSHGWRENHTRSSVPSVLQHG